MIFRSAKYQIKKPYNINFVTIVCTLLQLFIGFIIIILKYIWYRNE